MHTSAFLVSTYVIYCHAFGQTKILFKNYFVILLRHQYGHHSSA